MLARIDKLLLLQQQKERSVSAPGGVVTYSSEEELQLLQSRAASRSADGCTGGVMLVPRMLSIEEWERVATKAQRELAEGA